jgi:hypothetical protein
MSEFEEQFNIFLVPTPHQRKVFPPPPVPVADLVWQRAVRSDLMKINQSKVGHALLSAIKFHGMVVTIQPNQPGDCGEGTWPIDNDIPTGNPNLTITEGPNIWFSPEQHDLNNKCEASHKVFGQIHIESHEVLLHELVHVLRMVSFKLNPATVGKGFSFFHTTEEVFAVRFRVFMHPSAAPRSGHLIPGILKSTNSLRGRLSFLTPAPRHLLM